MDVIGAEFKECVVKYGEIALYFPVDAIRVINKCRELKKSIFGIDAFALNDHKIQPFMEYSLNLTDDRSDGVYSKAISHIEKYICTELVFEIVYEGY